jgi:hypothetical protein
LRDITKTIISPEGLTLSQTNKKSAQEDSWAELEKLLLNIKSSSEI